MEIVIKRIDERKYSDFCEKVMSYYDETGDIEPIVNEIDEYANVVKYKKDCGLTTIFFVPRSGIEPESKS